MRPGLTAPFLIRDSNNEVIERFGLVLSVDRVTMDGHKVIEVEFPDKIRKYSAAHI